MVTRSKGLAGSDDCAIKTNVVGNTGVCTRSRHKRSGQEEEKHTERTHKQQITNKYRQQARRSMHAVGYAPRRGHARPALPVRNAACRISRRLPPGRAACSHVICWGSALGSCGVSKNAASGATGLFAHGQRRRRRRLFCVTRPSTLRVNN